MPIRRIVQFAVATAQRPDEICRVERRDLHVERQMQLIRACNDPRKRCRRYRIVFAKKTASVLLKDVGKRAVGS